MGFVRKTAIKISDFFAFEMHNRWYKILFNNKLKEFVGVDYPISKEYSNAIDNLWMKKYGIRVDKRWFAHYAHCFGEESPYYIPDNIFHSIIEPYFNRDDYVKCMSNKNYFEKWLPNVKHVNTIARNIKGLWYDAAFNLLTTKDLLDLINAYGEFVAKPSSDSAGGAGVRFVTGPMDYKKIEELQGVFRGDFVIQEVLKQHSSLNQIYPHSVNTIRVMTFNWKGKVFVLSSLLRMGANGNRVDNMVSGGVNCAVYKDGSLAEKCYNGIGTCFIGHPNGETLKDKKIYGVKGVLDAAIECHRQLPYMGIISWDFAINEKGEPILIEFNLKPQGLDLHQRENGPIFGDMTVCVLDEVFKHKEK